MEVAVKMVWTVNSCSSNNYKANCELKRNFHEEISQQWK